ncbi:MAG: family 16 glycosylhydrolase [Lacipirellulaceae bacterium]
MFRLAQSLRWVLVVWAISDLSVCLVSANDNVAPGLKTKSQVESWTHEGDIVAVKRATDELPLSHQASKNEWQLWPEMTDEFEGEVLDEAKWMPRHRSWQGRQPAWFNPKNVTVKAGELQLTMRKEAAPEKLRRRGYHTYSSAAVHAREKVLYGYFEVCAQPMNSAGSSSFWFAGNGNGWRTEIDVFELSAKAKGFERRYNMNLHVFYTPESRKHWNVGDHWQTPWKLADDFHVYGLDWNEHEIVYYVDGVAVRKVENTHWHQPLYMIFDSETMPDWLGLPADEDLPSTYRVKYVRSWKRAEVKSEPVKAAAVN